MKKLGLISYLFLIGLSFCLLTNSAFAASKKVYRWKLQHDAPRGDILTSLLEHFSKDVERRSEGRLKIQVFADPEIVPGYELLQGVMAGTLEMANTSGLFQSGQVPLSAIEFGLPMMYKFDDSDGDFIKQANQIREFFFSSGMVELMRKEYAKYGVYWLDIHDYGPDTLFMTKSAKSVKDFKGLKMAMVPQFSSWIERLGAAATELAGGDLYMSLKMGVVDGGTWDINGVTALRFFEVGPNVMIDYANNHMIGHFEVNMKAWKALPDDLKIVLRDATEAWWYYKNRALEKIIQEAYAMGKKGDFKLMRLDTASMNTMERTAIQEWDSWSKKCDACEKAVAMQKAWYESR